MDRIFSWFASLLSALLAGLTAGLELPIILWNTVVSWFDVQIIAAVEMLPESSPVVADLWYNQIGPYLSLAGAIAGYLSRFWPFPAYAAVLALVSAIEVVMALVALWRGILSMIPLVR